MTSPVGFKARVGSLINAWQSVTCSLRFTFGVTHADHLVASMAAEWISSTYLRVSRHWWDSKPEPMPARLV